MIIDFHAHIYPEKIAARASSAISVFYENAPMAWTGTAEELIETGKKLEFPVMLFVQLQQVLHR